jgi:hypothetical protein
LDESSYPNVDTTIQVEATPFHHQAASALTTLYLDFPESVEASSFMELAQASIAMDNQGAFAASDSWVAYLVVHLVASSFAFADSFDTYRVTVASAS